MAINRCILLLIFIFSFAAIRTSATHDAKAYWNMKFPSVPMPALLEYMLPSASEFNYEKARASFNKDATMALYDWYDYELETSKIQRKNKVFTSIFIRQDRLKPGTIQELQYLGPANLGPPYMARDDVQKKLPFTSKNLPQILSAFSIKPNSKEAEMMKATLIRCEDPLRFSHHFCAPSLEDMADFITSQFYPSVVSKDVQVHGITVTPAMEVRRKYLITKVEQAGEGSNTISCHKAAFPYGTFMCHRLDGARAFRVQLQSLDNENVKVNALVGCHQDTSDWSPLYAAFEVLAIKPGQPVCHFLLADNIVFIKNN